jgi:hypothetical protein
MDNDGSMDLFGMVEDAASLAALAIYAGGHGLRDDKYGDSNRWARLGVVERLLESHVSIHKPLARFAIDDCRHFLREDNKYFDSFKEPEEAYNATRALLVRLEGMTPEIPFGLPRAINKGTGPKVPRRPKKKKTAAKKAAPKRKVAKKKTAKRKRTRGD